MKPWLFYLIGWCCCCCLALAKQPYTVMFYNVENYFDCIDDSLTNDDEFVPHKGKYWNYKRLATKRVHIARVIAAIGQGEPPVLVGLCEVENKEVLHQLVSYKPMSHLHYRFEHFESPDARGIDVALLYQPQWFEPIQSRAIPVSWPDGTHSRDVLYVKGLLAGADTLHVMVCHAPSRRGGMLQSEKKRMHAMSLVRQVADSVLAQQKNARVLIMGDFNDTPLDQSMRSGLGALPIGENGVTSLYNLMDPAQGTYKYQGQWSLFDQMVVSKSLLQEKGCRVQNGRAYVFMEDFLLQEDATYMGYKPYRTYLGPRYIGGYSDHLPIYLRLLVE